MPVLADLQALMIGSTARLSVRYRRHLYFSGRELPRPETLRVPTRHGRVKCQVYRPLDVTAPPAYLHFHGGAFVMRYPAMDDFFCRIVAAEVGAAVVNVDYDVAPRRRYPVAQEQAHDVLAWLSEHGESWEVDRQRIAIGGFSAGGNLAASASLQARDHGTASPRLQLLGVPSLDVSTTDKPAPSPHAMISPQLIRLVRRTYFTDASRRGEPYASPLLAPELTGLPRALVITAQIDRLRAEGDAFASRLEAAAVPVRHLVVPGRDHYFLDGPRDDARRVIDVMVEELRDALA